MKRILYAGGSFLTGDGIADAVLDYAAELANAGKAAKLTVPALDLEQQPEFVSLVVGPSSQLLAEPVAMGHELGALRERDHEHEIEEELERGDPLLVLAPDRRMAAPGDLGLVAHRGIVALPALPAPQTRG